ncbi:hypothetical protein FGO68_gene10039 [Halteria grandinella]|uniref:Uncharacterized protein n=1 Tax=Halteria grandinella TaxID=5974 RepID=A0A8J8NE54_HALGN|nr:hypothetical protein FGO68_gene10039 [Halteria grandinella]
MRIKELEKAHQKVLACEGRGQNGPYEAETEESEIDDWGNPIEVIERDAIFIKSNDIARAIKIRQRMVILKYLIKENQSHHLYERITRNAHFFLENQLEIICQLIDAQNFKNKNFLLKRFQFKPQVLSMILKYFHKEEHVYLFLWDINRKSREMIEIFLERGYLSNRSTIAEV